MSVAADFLPIDRLYLEQRVANHPDTSAVLSRYPDATLVTIDDYRTVFDRPKQEFQTQKQGRVLIVAADRGEGLYRGAARLDSFAEGRLFYNAPVRNCVYNCDYCFLQGMHPSGYTVLYLGDQESVSAVDRELESGPIYLCISYVTDLLAVESLIPNCRRWIES